MQASADPPPALGLAAADAEGPGDVSGENVAEADASGDADGDADGLALEGSSDGVADAPALAAGSDEPVGPEGPSDDAGGVDPSSGPHAVTTRQTVIAGSRAGEISERATNRA